MTAKEAVLDLLKRQKAIGETGESEDVPATIKDWQMEIGALMTRLRDWMKVAEEQGLMVVEVVPEQVSEERLGTYDVLELKVTTPSGIAVRITPRARYVVGALGRVDMECPPKKATLVRTAPEHWQIARLADARTGWSLRDLDEESFWQTLRELLS